MGYTTEFKGAFKFDSLPPAEVIVKLKEIEFLDGGDTELPDIPQSYCQWRLTSDSQGIEWDHSEKFYYYVEWLQWIIDNILTPAGVKLLGSVQYQGEEFDDRGLLLIDHDRVIQTEAKNIIKDYQELLEFRDFVENHPDGVKILAEWKNLKKTH